jgi:hypothetical protein
MLGKKLQPIFKEIADTTLEFAGHKQNYSDESLLDVTLIFQSVLMDKLYENQNYDNMPFKQRCEMATKCGEELRKLIHTYTGLDTHELSKN